MEHFVIIFALIFLCHVIWKYLQSPKNLPPGPVGIPILGYLPFISKRQNVTFSKLRAEYGDIFSLYIGQQLFVVMSTFELVKEAYIRQRNNFSGRPNLNSTVPPEFLDTKGIICNDGQPWVAHKQMALTFVKSCARSNGKGESIIQNEIQYLLQEIDKLKEKPMNIAELISYSTVNVIWALLFGERKDYSDEKFKIVLRKSEEHLQAIQFATIEIAFPLIFKIPYIRKLILAHKAMETYRYMHKYIDDEIAAAETFPRTQNEFSFVNDWFKSHPRDSENFTYHRDQLTPVVIDLYMAGSDTVSSTLQWVLLYVTKYQEVQQKVHEEIDEVIGRTSKPSISNKNKMPYTEATLMEVNRIATIAPFAVVHKNTTTATINGYTIPKNTFMLSNLWEIHHDPNIFPNPDQFQPDRFLENGKLKKVEEYVPFSIGNRQCIGESLARVELFLYFTTLLQRYALKEPEGGEIDLSFDFSLVIHPKPQKIRAITRR